MVNLLMGDLAKSKPITKMELNLLRQLIPRDPEPRQSNRNSVDRLIVFERRQAESRVGGDAVRGSMK